MSKKVPFYLFVVGLFLLIISPNLLSDGMFMDGLIYSTIAHNLSNGIGSFWNPEFTKTCMTSFHEHPPLAFGLQSLFYDVFGESRYIDKIYSLFTFIVVGFILLKIWKQLNLKNGWLPLLLWISSPLVSWASSNNMLEGTLSIFTSSSVLFYLIYLKEKKYLFLILAGLILSLGFLTKGFVAFYPLSLPFLWWILKRKNSFLKMTLDTTGLLLFSIVPLLLLVFIFPEARISLHKYIDIQVINSLKNVATVDSRFFIIKRLFKELIPVLILFVTFIFWAWRKKFSKEKFNPDYKMTLLFILLGLAGALPIMISMKQSGFYILTTFPFFAIGFGILLKPITEHLFNDQIVQSKTYVFFKWFSYFVFASGIVMSLYFANTVGREKERINDLYVIIDEIPEGATINIPPEKWKDWSLHAYYGRRKNISLDPDILNQREYLLIHRNELTDTSIMKGYQKIDLQTAEYELYKIVPNN